MIADGGKLSSVQTLRTIRHNTSDLNKSLRNMSSGLRVQKAADDSLFDGGVTVEKELRRV